MEPTTDLIYAAVGRTVVAMDRYSGRPVWRLKMPGLFKSGIVTLMVSGSELFAARGGYVYCLDRWTGQVLWERGLRAGGGTVILAAEGAGVDLQAAGATRAREEAAAAAAAAG